MKVSVQSKAVSGSAGRAPVTRRPLYSKSASSSYPPLDRGHVESFIRQTTEGVVGFVKTAPVTRRILRSMLGRRVSIRVNQEQVLNGIVTAVKIDKTKPTVLVSGLEFGLDQILTVAPADLSSI